MTVFVIIPYSIISVRESVGKTKALLIKMSCKAPPVLRFSLNSSKSP